MASHKSEVARSLLQCLRPRLYHQAAYALAEFEKAFAAADLPECEVCSPVQAVELGLPLD